MAYVNTFYVAANIIFDLETGKTNQVLMLSSDESGATTFTQQDANTYIEFVRRRARMVLWAIEGSRERPGLFVIKGVQNVE